MASRRDGILLITIYVKFFINTIAIWSCDIRKHFLLFSEAHLKSRQTFKMERFSKIVNASQLCNNLYLTCLTVLWIHLCFYYFEFDCQIKDMLTCHQVTLREKCPNTEVFLVRILLNSDWIQQNTGQKKLPIWTLFTQC